MTRTRVGLRMESERVSAEVKPMKNAEKAAAATGQQTTRTIHSIQRLSSIGELDDRLMSAQTALEDCDAQSPPVVPSVNA